MVLGGSVMIDSTTRTIVGRGEPVGMARGGRSIYLQLYLGTTIYRLGLYVVD